MKRDSRRAKSDASLVSSFNNGQYEIFASIHERRNKNS